MTYKEADKILGEQPWGYHPNNPTIFLRRSEWHDYSPMQTRKGVRDTGRNYPVIIAEVNGSVTARLHPTWSPAYDPTLTMETN